MKIAIYHNLNMGGALVQLIKIKQILNKNHTVHVFTPKQTKEKGISFIFFKHKLTLCNNLIGYMINILIFQKFSEKEISNRIKEGDYDMVLVFPCKNIQSPNILRYLRNHKGLIYMFQEPKREFYEQTSFDYYTAKQMFFRLIKLPIKYIDKLNCKSVNNIIVNSNYSKQILSNIYGKNGTVVYPGMQNIKRQIITRINNKKVIVVGLVSYLKGYEFTFKQISGILNEITIIGKKSHDSKYLFDMAKSYNINVNYIRTDNDQLKLKILKKHSIFLANQINEPFGITTLEATNHNCFVLGLNQGGTPEIITNNQSGVLYNNSIEESKLALIKILKKHSIVIHKTKRINWYHMCRSILLYHTKTSNE